MVYDRIRENLKKYRKMPMPELLDLSVNETLARTVMTSLTLLVVLVPLLFFGPGEPVRLHRGDHAGHLRRHLQLDLHGRADPDLAGGQLGDSFVPAEAWPSAGPARGESAFVIASPSEAILRGSPRARTRSPVPR